MRLEHVGSTAVPGLAAKPIIDLQLSVDGIQPRERYVQPLKRLGYLFVPSPESPDYHFFAKPLERPRTHHLHICASGSEHELRRIGVRDFLRTHADEAARYAALTTVLFWGRPATPGQDSARDSRSAQRMRISVLGRERSRERFPAASTASARTR